MLRSLKTPKKNERYWPPPAKRRGKMTPKKKSKLPRRRLPPRKRARMDNEVRLFFQNVGSHLCPFMMDRNLQKYDRFVDTPLSFVWELFAEVPQQEADGGVLVVDGALLSAGWLGKPESLILSWARQVWAITIDRYIINNGVRESTLRCDFFNFAAIGHLLCKLRAEPPVMFRRGLVLLGFLLGASRSFKFNWTIVNKLMLFLCTVYHWKFARFKTGT